MGNFYRRFSNLIYRCKMNALLSFNNFGDSSLGILFIYHIKKGANILVTQSEINLAIMKQFEEHGLEMAYPTRTVNTKKV